MDTPRLGHSIYHPPLNTHLPNKAEHWHSYSMQLQTLQTKHNYQYSRSQTENEEPPPTPQFLPPTPPIPPTHPTNSSYAPSPQFLRPPPKFLPPCKEHYGSYQSLTRAYPIWRTKCEFLLKIFVRLCWTLWPALAL